MLHFKEIAAINEYFAACRLTNCGMRSECMGDVALLRRRVGGNHDLAFGIIARRRLDLPLLKLHVVGSDNVIFGDG